MKELYVSEESVRAKGQEWLRSLEPYSKGRDDFIIEPSSSVLVVMDMQEFFLNEKSHAFLPSSKAIVPSIESLVSAFREKANPVVFTYHALRRDEDPGIMGRWWKDVIREGTPASKIIPALKPTDSDIVVRKTRYSAFHGTGLEKDLKERGVKSLVITGVMTHLCCESTARAAFMKDFEVYFVVDATATQYEELHLSSLRTLSDGFAVPVTTDHVLKSFGGR